MAHGAGNRINLKGFKQFEAFFLWCAVHGDSLGGASPLWGFVIANH
jgi:hypothetical protein